MAESCLGTTRASLENMQAWYIAMKRTLLHWLNGLMPKSHDHWQHYGGDGSTSSSDSQNFGVGSHGRYADQVNLKYGLEPEGAALYDTSDQYSCFTPK